MNTRKRILAILCAMMTALVFAMPAASFAETQAAGSRFTPVQPEVDASYTGPNATRIPVITYHNMASAKEKKGGIGGSSLYISKTRFDKQMKYLHVHNWRTLSMEEFYLWHQGKIRVPRKSVVITFDDGNYSIIKYALPTLKKYNMRATIFMIGKRTHAKTRTASKGKGRYGSIGLDVMKKVSDTYPNFEFQSHTWNMHHRNGDRTRAKHLPLSAQMKDMKKQYKTFGYTYLAYPYGAYSDRTIKAAKANGIKLAFTYGKSGYAKRSQNKYKIRRIKISAGDSMKTFKKWFR